MLSEYGPYLEKDIAKALDVGRTATQADHARASGVLTDAKFKNWIHAPSSNIMIIQGNDAAYQRQTFSGLSFYAAMLNVRLNVHNIVQPLTFFCGRHKANGNPLEGAVGLLRALLFQLLRRYGDSLDLSRVTAVIVPGIMNGNLHDLGQLFGILIHSLATQTGGFIVCLVDGANFLESEQHRGAFKWTINWIGFLMESLRSENSNLYFKVLLLFPQRSERAITWVGDENLLNASANRYAWLDIKDPRVFEPALDRCFLP